MEKIINILLTFVGRRTYIVKYFKDALNSRGKVHVSNSIHSVAFNEADNSVISPLIYDSNYIDFLLEYSLKNNISAIISLFDIDLTILSKFKDFFFNNGIKVVVSDSNVVEICNDKWGTYNFLLKNNISTPKTYISIKEVLKSLQNNIISFPMIVKPRWGMGSISIYIAENVDELNVFYKKTLNNINHTYIKYESLYNIEDPVIFQELVIGQEYGLDVINDLQSNYITTLVKKKKQMRSGETDSAITVNNKILKNIGRKISVKLKHISNLDIDCFLTNNDIPYIIDMNCRIGGHYPFSHLAGADLPLAIINWLSGKKVNNSLLDIKYGIEGVKDIKPLLLKS